MKTKNQIIDGILLCKKQPFVLKDPRLVIALDWWTPYIPHDTVLVYLKRDRDRLYHSFEKRGKCKSPKYIASNGLTVDELIERANKQYKKYPYAKVKFTYEQVMDAVSVFDTKRNDKNSKNIGKIGYQ